MLSTLGCVYIQMDEEVLTPQMRRQTSAGDSVTRLPANPMQHPNSFPHHSIHTRHPDNCMSRLSKWYCSIFHSYPLVPCLDKDNRSPMKQDNFAQVRSISIHGRTSL